MQGSTSKAEARFIVTRTFLPSRHSLSLLCEAYESLVTSPLTSSQDETSQSDAKDFNTVAQEAEPCLLV